MHRTMRRNTNLIHFYAFVSIAYSLYFSVLIRPVKRLCLRTQADFAVVQDVIVCACDERQRKEKQNVNTTTNLKHERMI